MMRLRLWPPVHEFYDTVLRPFGLRDRLRCLNCGAVGTFKPHGGWADRRAGDTRGARRWLCKYCGYYIGPEGVLQAFPHREIGTWVLPEPFYTDVGPPTATPEEVVQAALGATWPWRG